MTSLDEALARHEAYFADHKEMLPSKDLAVIVAAARNWQTLTKGRLRLVIDHPPGYHLNENDLVTWIPVDALTVTAEEEK